MYDLTTMTEVANHFLPGQPDSIRLSPNGQYAAVIIENERDEDVEVDGVEGGLPQFPAGLGANRIGHASGSTIRPQEHPT